MAKWAVHPTTIRDVDLPARIRAAGGASLREAGEYFGWSPSHLSRDPGEFSREELLARGWTRKRLLDVAEGYDHIARLSPSNPSARIRANQLREIVSQAFG